ncbi:MAG: AMP-binding protein [Deltaproteobacteria bacterium]|nr:AMP-binding protein [Deltaproteobacteria bacterium]
MSDRKRENERIDTQTLEQLQLEQLQSTINRAWKHVPFYKRRFQSHGVEPAGLRAIQDIAALPFTTRQDLGDDYPYGLFAVPLRDIVRISPAPGTTAKPVVVGFTRSDLRVRNQLTARFLSAAGVGDMDVVQICLNPGLSNWARALKEGAEVVGASVMPFTMMSTAKQLMVMEDFKTSVLLTTPSYGMHLLDTMEGLGKSARDLALKTVLVVGESLKDSDRNALEMALGVKVFVGYGPSDVLGPAVAFECPEKQGLHVNEDHFLLEIVDPRNTTPLPPGREGEIVLTTLTARAFPLIRFRTGDVARILEGPCACGRTFVRISTVSGHVGNILTIRGVKTHPTQIAQILAADPKTASSRFLIHLYKENHLDMVEIWLEMTPLLFSDEVKNIEQVLKRLRKHLFQRLGLEATIRLVESLTFDLEDIGPGGVVDHR